MTVDTTGSDGAVTPYDPSAYADDIGLEDIGASDIIIPRLQIQHASSTFKDNLSGVEYKSLEVILLGQVKQRIMWAGIVEDNDKPLCKSPDYVHGFPQVTESVPADKRFPWDESNFTPAQVQLVELTPGQDPAFPNGYTSNGLETLPCAACVFNQWTKNPKTNKSIPPSCTEQHTYPLLYSPDNGDSWIAALLTLQRTGLKPSKAYISSFAQTKTPMFTVKTNLSLQAQTRGTVVYSVPVFSRGAGTDRNNWSEYGNQLRAIREFVRQAPRAPEIDGNDDALTAPSSNVNTAPEPTGTVAAPPAAPTGTVAAPVASAPLPPKAPVTVAPAVAAPVAAAAADDDLPF